MSHRHYHHEPDRHPSVGDTIVLSLLGAFMGFILGVAASPVATTVKTVTIVRKVSVPIIEYLPVDVDRPVVVLQRVNGLTHKPSCSRIQVITHNDGQWAKVCD